MIGTHHPNAPTRGPLLTAALVLRAAVLALCAAVLVSLALAMACAGQPLAAASAGDPPAATACAGEPLAAATCAGEPAAETGAGNPPAAETEQPAAMACAWQSLAMACAGQLAYAAEPDSEPSGAQQADTANDQAKADDTDDVQGDGDSASGASGDGNGDGDEAQDGKADSAAQSPASAPITQEAPVEVDGEHNRIDPTQRADNSFIYDTTIESLFSQSSLYEGKIVQVSGEVIGDIVVESPVGSKNCWITLTEMDAGNAATISVLLSNEQASQIDHLGRYGVTGTTLQVRGVYHQACQEHEGLPDVHATEANVIARGSEHPDKFVLEDFIPGFIAVAAGLILMWVYYFVRERMR